MGAMRHLRLTLLPMTTCPELLDSGRDGDLYPLAVVLSCARFRGHDLNLCLRQTYADESWDTGENGRAGAAALERRQELIMNWR